jgi:hypothetical protein
MKNRINLPKSPAISKRYTPLSKRPSQNILSLFTGNNFNKKNTKTVQATKINGARKIEYIQQRPSNKRKRVDILQKPCYLIFVFENM